MAAGDCELCDAGGAILKNKLAYARPEHRHVAHRAALRGEHAAAARDQHHAMSVPQLIENGQGLAERSSAHAQAGAGRNLCREGCGRRPGVVGRSQRFQGNRRPAGCADFNFVPGLEQPLGAGIGIGRVPFAVAEVAILDLGPERGPGCLECGRLIEDENRLVRQIVEEGSHLRVEIRRAPFRIRRNRGIGFRAVFRTKVFPRRQDDGVVDLTNRGLRRGVEQPEGLDRIPKKFHAERIGVPGRKNIHQAASNAELAGNLHHGDAPVAEAHEALAVGTLEECASWGPHTVDRCFEGEVIVPGFVEAHGHTADGMISMMPYVGYHDFPLADGGVARAVRGYDELIEVLKKADATLPEGQPLIANSFDPIYFPGEARLSKEHLDRVSTKRQVIVRHASGHLLTVNSVVLREEKIGRDCATPGVQRGADGLAVSHRQMLGPSSV